MSTCVLMIEDDTALSAMVVEYLAEAGFEVIACADGASGLRRFDREGIEAVILDVMLPDTDGFELCRQIRARSDVPVLMLTARGEETDRIVGLEIGADDYLPKPFNPRELLARLRAIVRRRGAGAGSATPAQGVLRFGRLEIDLDQHAVRLDGRAVALTGHQFELLRVLARNVGRVMSRDALMNALRGENLEAFDRSIDVHISRIRAVIEDDPRDPKRVLTVRGAGYVMARRQDA